MHSVAIPLIPVPPLSMVDAVNAHEIAELRAVVKRTIACVLHEHQDSAEVDDAVQETLRRALEATSLKRSESELRSYVLGIARHVAVDEIRARQKRRARTVALDDSLEGIERATQTFSAEDSSDDSSVVADEISWLRDELQRLPERQRDAIVLFHVSGLSYGAIAKQLGVPFGTVATWISRARNTLAEKRKRHEHRPIPKPEQRP